MQKRVLKWVVLIFPMFASLVCWGAGGTTIFEAAPSNTTLVDNDSNDTSSMTITGSPGALVLSNGNGDFNMGGFVSTDSINTLNGANLTASNTVIIKITVDDISGTIRANGINFGMVSSSAYCSGTSNLIMEARSANSGSAVVIASSSFMLDSTEEFDTGYAATDAALYDGFTITLTANIAGYNCVFESIGATSPITFAGTFEGTEFLDYFGAGHFYYTAQKFNTGSPLVSTISEASISIGEYIEEIVPSLPPVPPVLESVSEGVAVFEATAENSTMVFNSVQGTPATGSLANGPDGIVVTNAGVSFGMVGFASNADINTLNGAALTASDMVTLKLVVDDLEGTIRANGINFGLSSDLAHLSGVNNLVIGAKAANAGGGIGILSSFQDISESGYDATDAELYDGFTLTLTADVNGYVFVLEGVGNTDPVTVRGSFAGTEFLDYFGTGHFYYSAQQFNTGVPLISTLSEASIEITDRSVRKPLFFADFDSSSAGSGAVSANATAANLDAGTSIGSWYFPYLEPGAILSDGAGNQAFVLDHELATYSENRVYALFDRSVDLTEQVDLVLEMDLYAAQQTDAQSVSFSLVDGEGHSAYCFEFGMPSVPKFSAVNSSGLEAVVAENGTGVNAGFKSPAVDGYQSWGATMIHVKAQIIGQPTQAGNRGALLSIDWNGDGDYSDAGELVEAHVGPRVSGITKICSLELSTSGTGGVWMDNLSVTAGISGLDFATDHHDLAKFQSDGKESQQSSDGYYFSTDGMVAVDSRWISSGSSDHWVSLELATPMTIGSAHLFSGGAGNAAMSNVRIQYHTGSAWSLIPGAYFSGNTSGALNIAFDEPITAQKFRVYSSDATARVRELALYPPTADGAMVPFGTDLDLNCAKLRQYSFSSVSGANYPKLALDGYVADSSAWVSADSSDTHSLSVSWPRGECVGSVHVYSGYEGQAGTQIQNFQLSYKNGGDWIPFDGGLVVGNTELERVVLFDAPQNVTEVQIEILDEKQAILREFVVLPNDGPVGYPLGTDVQYESPSEKSFLDYGDHYYTLENRATGLNLSSSSSGTTLTADEDPWFQVLLNIGTETYRLRSKESEKCFEVAAASTNAGAAIVEGTYKSMPHQRWKLIDSGDGTHFQIVNVWSGLALDVAGDQVVQQPLTADQSQQWNIDYEDHFPKRGQNANIHFNTLFKPSWIYDWRVTPKSTVTIGQYMPMQWGNMSSATPSLLKYQATWYGQANQTSVLVFNEPDKEDQANISETKAAALWPRFERMRLPLVGPVPAAWNGSWRKAYEAQASEEGFRCEYTAMHWYAECGGGSPGNIISCINTLYNTYKKPVWITEFAVKDWSGSSTKWDRKDNYNWLAEFVWRAESIEGLAKYSMFEWGNSDSNADINENDSPSMGLHIKNDSTDPGFEDLSEIGLLMAGWDGDATIRDDKSYIIHNTLGMRLIDNPADSTIGSSNILNRASTEQFQLQAASDGKKYLVGVSTGRLLCCTGSSVSLAAKGTTGTAVEWSLSTISYGWVRIDHPSTGKRLYIYSNGDIGVTSDGNTWDSTKFRFITPPEAIAFQEVQELPYAESFEAGVGAWRQGTDDGYDWSIGTGYTDSNTTGPSAASDGTDYLFAEGHDGGQYAITTIECLFNLSSVTAAELRFDYHMAGGNIGTLAIDVFDGASWSSNVWTRVGAQQSDEDEPWLAAVVDLAPYVGNAEVTLRFRYSKVQWAYGDPAIDNIWVDEPSAYDEWAQAAFANAAEGANLTAAGNPDGDRLGNAMEWALNTDPLTADFPVLNTSLSNEFFTTQYQRRDPEVTGIDVYASWATSLTNQVWLRGGDELTETSKGWSNGVETVNVALPITYSNAYIRVEISEE